MSDKATTIAKFCGKYGIGRTTFFEMRRRGEAPAIITVGRRVIIPAESVRRWESERLQQASEYAQ